MTLSVVGVLILLVGLLTLVSYVDRVYQEAGKFLSREFQDNVDVFEQKIEPKLGVARSRAALSMAVLEQLTTAAIAVLIYALSGARPQAPDLEGFIDGDDPAWHSPPLLAGLRRRPARRLLAEEAA